MARKTNSKEVKHAVREYLKENVNVLLEEREIETEKPFTAYFNIINNEKQYQKYNNDFEMFKDWLQGLGGFGDDIYYFPSKKGFEGGKCQDILQDWLQQTNEEVKKYTQSQSEELMLYLCWREFQYMMNKEV